MPVAYGIMHHENGTFGVSFPDFPGCITVGQSEEEAVRKADEILTFHVRGLLEDGEPLPFLRSVGELWQDPDFEEDMKGGVLFLARFETAAKSVRLNISMDESLLEAVDGAAAATGQSRSGFIAHAVRDRIRGPYGTGSGGRSPLEMAARGEMGENAVAKAARGD